MKNLQMLFLLMLLTISACRSGDGKPRLFVAAIDLSASIEPKARDEAFAAIVDLTKIMKRGDRLVIIPIASDPAVYTQGRVLRFELAQERQAYDQDIKQFSQKIQKLLGEMARQSALKPSAQTDILGSVRVARQEIAVASRYSAVLIFLSDFIQDNQVANFERSENLGTRLQGERLGKSIAERDSLRLAEIPVYLGWLRSADLARLNSDRRNGIEGFWMAYFKTSGAKPFSATDGSGLLVNFLQSEN